MKKITLLGCCILLVGGLFFTSCNNNSKQEKPITGWDKLAGIRNNIQPPTFPDKDFFIMDFGAVQDSTKDCLPAIKKAITACNEAGGGRVIIPEGTWFVKGPIHLKSNVRSEEHTSELQSRFD